MVHLSHKEASRTIDALRPQYRDAAALLSALKESAERLSDGGGLSISTVFQGKSAQLPLLITDAFFRIGQEAVSNAIQHSRCRELTISLKLSKREASLSVADSGFSDGLSNEGLGMAGMRSRASRIKGRLEIVTSPAEGTVITVVAPLPLTGSLLSRLRNFPRHTSGR
jgi:signal transduction histidine kinase